MLMLNWFRQIQERAEARARARYVIVVTDAGVGVRDIRRGSSRWFVGWDEVQEIAAYKRDMYSWDDICLGFLAPGRDRYFECDEDMPGWDGLNEELERRFRILFSEWAPGIVKPAFAENLTVLWTRIPT